MSQDYDTVMDTEEIDKLSDDELGDLIDREEFGVVEEDEETSEEIPEEDSVDETDDEEESEEDESDEEEEEPIAAESPDLDEIMRRLDLAEARADKAESQADLWRTRADQNAGRLGNLLQQQKRTPAYETGYEEDAPATSESSEIRDELAELRQQRNFDAMRAEEQAFQASNAFTGFVETIKSLPGEVAEKEYEAFVGDIHAAISEVQEELQAALASGTPKSAARLAKSAYGGALADAKIKFLKRRESEAAELRATKKSEAKKRKLKASSSSGSTGKKAKRKLKSPDDMTDEELKELIDAGLGDV